MIWWLLYSSSCFAATLGLVYNCGLRICKCALVLVSLVCRMLDEHFMDQMNEIIRLCPRGRQTLLFSATMTDEVRNPYLCLYFSFFEVPTQVVCLLR